MKRLFFFMLILCASFSSFAQTDSRTDSFKVDGNCNMCKKRIEDAAYVKGVKRADWNVETHMLTVTYKPSKASEENVMKAIAKAGHNTEKVVSTETDYNKLPECCQYKTNTCDH